MIEIVRHLLRGLLAALLPSPERERYAREREVDAPRWSLAVGLAQLVSGGLLFLVLGFGYMATGSVSGALALILEGQFEPDPRHDPGLGPIHWFAWLLHPASWPLGYLTAVGALRCVAYVAAREAVGEPLVLAAMRIVQRRRARKDDTDFRERLGPWRRDRVIADGERELVVLSSREKPAWTETVTIEHRGRYYKCVEVELRPDDAREVLAYRLREEPPGAIIRRLVRYDGPGRD